MSLADKITGERVRSAVDSAAAWARGELSEDEATLALAGLDMVRDMADDLAAEGRAGARRVLLLAGVGATKALEAQQQLSDGAQADMAAVLDAGSDAISAAAALSMRDVDERAARRKRIRDGVAQAFVRYGPKALMLLAAAL